MVWGFGGLGFRVYGGRFWGCRVPRFREQGKEVLWGLGSKGLAGGLIGLN